MKILFPFLAFFFPALLWSQIVDSTAIFRQVDSLIQVSQGLTAKRDLDQALEINDEAEKIALEKLGQESAPYGSCCFNRGRVLYYKGELSEAEKWYLESIAIRGKSLGKEHPNYAKSLNNLAVLYRDLGRYEQA